MPPRATKTKPAQPVAPTPPPPVLPIQAAPAPSDNGRKVVYPKMDIRECSTTSPHGPLTIEKCKKALGWEPESEYKQRMVRENPGTEEKAYSYGDDYHCKNLAGEKVRCRYNSNNRPFDAMWCESLIHTILYGQWAGPHTVPGETVNGETVRISRYGEVLSGQHQMTALILAGEWLAKARQNRVDLPTAPKYPTWQKHGEPFIETIVITGVSEDPRVLMTIDNTKPRSAADVFYTSQVFRNCTSIERKELCRLLAQAVDFLWTRTDARGYRTHPEIVAFLDRHKTLLKCVLHIYKENSVAAKRKLSKLGLNAGHCAAIMYLQAVSKEPDEEYGDIYRNETPAPSEKSLNWEYWDKAEEYWTLLGDGRDFLPVRAKLGRLAASRPTDPNNQGLGGDSAEKLVILANAWDRWKEHMGRGQVFDADDSAPGGILWLNYTDTDSKGKKLPENQIELVSPPAFFAGIDAKVIHKSSRRPDNDDDDGPVPSPEEMERMLEEARQRRAQDK